MKHFETLSERFSRRVPDYKIVNGDTFFWICIGMKYV